MTGKSNCMGSDQENEVYVSVDVRMKLSHLVAWQLASVVRM